MEKLTIKECKYDTALRLVDADIVANDIKIVNNVVYHHLVLKENVAESSIAIATMSNVQISNNTSLKGTGKIWDTVLLEYDPDRMNMQNVNVQMQQKEAGCMVVHNDKQLGNFTDFVNVICPEKYPPNDIDLKDSLKRYACTVCGISAEKREDRTGRGHLFKNSMYVNLIALILIILAHRILGR